MSFSAVPGAVVGAAHSAIEYLAALLTPVAGGLSVALAIVVFTVLVRVAVSPLSYLRLRSARRRVALAPQLAALRERHAGDPVRLAAETVAVQRAHGAGPFAGLVPGLVQAPFFMVMYRVAADPPAGAVFGVPLGAHLAAGPVVFAVLLVVAAVVAWWSARRTPELPEPLRLLRYLPFLTLAGVAWLPLAGALYLVTSTAVGAFEQAWGPPPVRTGKS
jgi:YidC/Oxa1 family membrane protein insertase